MRLWLNWIEQRVSAPRVVGSNPTRRAIYHETPIKPWFVEVLEYKNTTLLQLFKEFIETDTSYLQKIKNIYYLVYKYDGKIIKKSLRSSNLKYSNIEKLKMINIIKKELGLEFQKISNNHLQIIIQAEEGDDPEEVEKLRNRTLNAASKLQKNRKVKTISTDEISNITIEKAYEDFISNEKTLKKNFNDDTLKNYNSAFSYVKLFLEGGAKANIIKLNSSFWSYLQEALTKTPTKFSVTPSLQQKGIEKVILENEKLKLDLKLELEKSVQDIKKIDKIKLRYKTLILDTLSNNTINKHFTFYKKFMNYLEKNDYMKNTIKVNVLDEEDSNKETFLYREMKQLFSYELTIKDKNSYSSEEYQNMFKFGFLSGMRRGEILKLTKDSIVKVNDILCLDIKEAKTKESIRLVPISEDMKKIIDIQYKKSKNGFLFFDNEPRFIKTSEKERAIGKRLNRKIDDFLKDNGYIDKSVKSFHSLRGNFIQELYRQLECKNISSELYIKMLVGHKEQSKNITFTTYNKSQVSIEILKDCIDKVTLDLVYGAVKENKIEKIKVNEEDYTSNLNF